MKARRFAVYVIACLSAGISAAGDQLAVDGALDMRWVHATGEASYLDGGLGSLRFDSDHEDLRLGRAFMAARLGCRTS